MRISLRKINNTDLRITVKMEYEIRNTKERLSKSEIKKKYKGLVNKRRVALPMEEAERFLIHGIMPSNPTTSSVFIPK